MKPFWGALLAAVVTFSGFEARAQNAYPPSNILKAGSQVSLELRQTWTSTIKGKDSDGDWTGDAKGSNGTAGTLFSFSQNNGSFVWQVAFTGGSEYCLLPNATSVNSSLSSTNRVVYEGVRLNKVGNADPVADNIGCRVVVNNGGSQPAPTPPAPPPPPTPSNNNPPALSWPVNLAVGQKWEFRLGNRPVVYRVAFSSVENRGGTNVYLGTLNTEGTADPVAQRKLEIFYSADTLAAYATDPQGGVTVCSFQGSSSLQNNVLTGAVYFRAAGASQFTTLTDANSAPCKANLEPQSGAIATPPAPPTQVQASFPPKVGQSWTVSIDGIAPWIIKYNSVDKTDVVGVATQSGVNQEALAFTTSAGAKVFAMTGKDGVYYCVFGATIQANGASFVGGTSVFQATNAKELTDLQKSCTATITADVSGSTTVVSNTPITPTNLVASFPPKPGQTWVLNIDGLSPWTMNFTKLDSDGDPTGTATQNGVTKAVFAFVDEGEQYFQVFDAKSTVFYCVFPANTRPNGAVASGGDAFTAPNSQADLVAMNKSCSVTLQNQTILQTQVQSLEVFASHRLFGALPTELKLIPNL